MCMFVFDRGPQWSISNHANCQQNAGLMEITRGENNLPGSRVNSVRQLMERLCLVSR